MANQEKRTRKKGTFADIRLPVIRKYIFPGTRLKMILIGGGVALVVLAYALFNIFFQKGSFISNGPLTSNHANFEEECVSCHAPGDSPGSFAAVTNERCSSCHEKYGDKLGVYTYKAHYIYRSDDFDRLRSNPHEQQCYVCHAEHQGRENRLTDVSDKECLVCHRDEKNPQFNSFNDGHPQFEFARTSRPEVTNLRFPHIMHVEEIQKKEGLVDIEQACLFCHKPQPDGKSFQPISFDASCDACHLTTSDKTPFLPVKSGNSIGVETMSSIRNREGARALWAFYTNENEFRVQGAVMQKGPLHHQDPWVMENLALLRKELYPDLGIAELLKSTGDVPTYEVRKLYVEAVKTLRTYADGLRSRPEPEIQRELLLIGRQLDKVEETLRDPYASLDDTKFLLSTAVENPRLNTDDKNQITRVVDNLTKPCQKCHYLSHATILRARADQKTLRRAEFNHRAHILQRRCLECHTAIPFAGYVGNKARPTEAQDNSGIQNIPTIETCLQCHTASNGSNACRTCHEFHPNKNQRSNLLLYLH